MSERRRVREILTSLPTMEGAGVRLRRAFGWHEVPKFDPFLMLDDFRSDNPDDYIAGFPWHPHRGIETITYLQQGVVEHGDSLGNQGRIGAGEVQWMTAGSGIIHQEMPQQTADGRLHGFQLWANLPAAHKMMPPRYRDVQAADIPTVVQATGANVQVICGCSEDTVGPVQDIVTKPEFFVVAVAAGGTFHHQLPAGYTAFAYVMDGQAHFDSEQVASAYQVVLYERQGTEICVQAAEQAVQFLFCAGQPLQEPIAWRGPIVMNTQAELKQAFHEFNQGTFIKGDS